jgi:hypothetical protein
MVKKEIYCTLTIKFPSLHKSASWMVSHHQVEISVVLPRLFVPYDLYILIQQMRGSGTVLV